MPLSCAAGGPPLTESGLPRPYDAGKTCISKPSSSSLRWTVFSPPEKSEYL